MANPLVPELYRRLEERFGHVKISNEGESMVIQESASPTAKREVSMSGGAAKMRREIIHPGEYYRINCPRCPDGDTRHRLWINHRAAEFPWLIVCYNEDCYNSPEARDALLMKIFDTRRPPRVEVKPGKTDNAKLSTTDWPGETIPLHELPHNHPANDYLYERGYDPFLLSQTYSLRFCEESQEFRQCRGRIIIPVVMRGQMVGWQARFVGERNWKDSPSPKYWDKPGMPKRLMLYNHDQAAKYPFVVVEEGVTDVWSTGPMAVSIRGGTVTFQQKRLLVFPPFQRKVLVMMLDGDAALENEATVTELKRIHPGGVVLVALPENVDPGSLTPEVNLDLIYSAAAAQGVALPEVSIP